MELVRFGRRSPPAALKTWGMPNSLLAPSKIYINCASNQCLLNCDKTSQFVSCSNVRILSSRISPSFLVSCHWDIAPSETDLPNHVRARFLLAAVNCITGSFKFGTYFQVPELRFRSVISLATFQSHNEGQVSPGCTSDLTHLHTLQPFSNAFYLLLSRLINN